MRPVQVSNLTQLENRRLLRGAQAPLAMTGVRRRNGESKCLMKRSKIRFTRKSLSCRR